MASLSVTPKAEENTLSATVVESFLYAYRAGMFLLMKTSSWCMSRKYAESVTMLRRNFR